MCLHYNLTAEDIQAQSDALVEFHAQFADCFLTQKQEMYLPTLLSIWKGNFCVMREKIEVAMVG